MKPHSTLLPAVAVVASVSALLPFTSAQTAPKTEDVKSLELIELDALVVTGVSRPDKTKMQSSVSVSSLPAERLGTSVPRSTAEIFRTLPGVRVEASSGEGNVNMAVRGIPVSDGGSRYIQLQEDGLPVVEFGDISFSNADVFFRADANLGNIEVVRGGSAAIFASNSPGAVINAISKNGVENGGSASVTQGLDFNSTRLDLGYGGALNADYRFSVGGFYRHAEGPRTTGSKEGGGQIKLNLTRAFQGGHFRVYAKVLDDTAFTYMPAPAKGTGLDDVQGFDVGRSTQYSNLWSTDRATDLAGNLRLNDINGIHAKSAALGMELQVSPTENLTITDRARFADQKAHWVVPFPADVKSLAQLRQGGGFFQSTDNAAGARFYYANGDKKGQELTDSNHLLSLIHMFNSDMDDLSWIGNDLKANQLVVLGSDTKLDLTGGLYLSRQKIAGTWSWSEYLADITEENAALVDVIDGNGTRLSENGLTGYNTVTWGTVSRRYDLAYDTSSPYASVTLQKGKFTFDAGVRMERVKASGTFEAATNRSIDLNKDGTISRPETYVPVLTGANVVRYNYSVKYTNYSAGANYALNKDLALFARTSKGGRATADRLDQSLLNADGSLKGDDKAAYQDVTQTEVGIKTRSKNLLPGTLSANATLFYTKTREPAGYELNVLRPAQTFDSKGVELEAGWSYQGFALRGTVTYTDANADGANGAAGYTPRRQAEWIYSVEPSYSTGRFGVGFALIGTTDSYFQNNNDLKMPGYNYVNAFINYAITPRLIASLDVNNLLDTTGFTEGEEGSLPSNGIVRARSIPGRTTAVTLRYTF